MKRPFYTGYNPEMKGRSRELRREMTRHEKHLWYDFLRRYPVKFYRQRSIDRFIVDFYCSAAHLAVEVDGGQHYTAQGSAYDKERTAVLKDYGITVIRITNDDIENRFSEICERIDKIVKQRVP